MLVSVKSFHPEGKEINIKETELKEIMAQNGKKNHQSKGSYTDIAYYNDSYAF